MVSISINDMKIAVPQGTTILNAAREAGIYIPVLCSHPDIKPFRSLELSERIYQGARIVENDPGATMESIKGCGLCIVEIDGSDTPVPSCKTPVEEGMVILTDTETLKKKRLHNLKPIFALHPHSCLTCSQREGCITTSGDCSNSVPIEERCCEINGNCELQRIGDYIGIAPETPKFHHLGIPRIEDGGLFIRDFNLCISCGRCVRACQQIRGVYALGAVIKDGKLVVGTVNGPEMAEAECRFCGACVEVCPTGSLQDKRKARLKEVDEYVPCKANCPGGVEIPAYLRLVSQGDRNGAAEVISSRLSFPNSLGKVCFHPCETDCRRNDLSKSLSNEDGAVSIRQAKDYAMTGYDMPATSPGQADTGKKISVVGAGPAGLTTAYYLSLKGHQVTVYEKEPEIGGMLRYGIPRYRLPEDSLRKDLDWLLTSGMEVKTNVEIGKDKSIQSLLDGADAVYVGGGLPLSRRLGVDVPENDNVHYGVEFLNKVSKGDIPGKIFANKKIVVIGGGNVATDAARTAVRLGAEITTMVCLEAENEMPAYDQEIFESIEEGISIKNGWGISSINVLPDEKLKIDLMKCTSVFNENGDFSPEYDKSITDILDCDAVIVCIGQMSDPVVISGMEDRGILDRGLIKTNSTSTATNISGLFAGGDMVSGPASVIDAVGAGKKAAREIDKYLGGDGIIKGAAELDMNFDPFMGRKEGFCMLKRADIKLADPETRKNNFDAVEISFDDQTAVYETARCLQCDLRMDIRQNPSPPEKYLEFTRENIDSVDPGEGVVQLLDNEKKVFLIKGSDNIRANLDEFFDEDKEAAFFTFEYDPLFSQRESELLQQHLQEHGEMPDSGDDLDDLF